MAFYTPTISNPNTIGGISSEVIVINTVSDFNTFTAQASSENLVLSSINIISLNNDIGQVSQPITFTTKDANGNETKISQVPTVDSYSFRAQIQNLAILSNFNFEGLNKIDYPVLGGQAVKMTLSVDKKDAVLEQAKKAFGYTGSTAWENTVRDEMGLFREPEEIKVEQPVSPIVNVEQKEPSEIKQKETVFTPSKVISNELKEPDETAKIPIKVIEKPVSVELKEPEEVPKNAPNKENVKKEAKKEDVKEVPKLEFTVNYWLLGSISLLTIYAVLRRNKEN